MFIWFPSAFVEIRMDPDGVYLGPSWVLADCESDVFQFGVLLVSELGTGRLATSCLFRLLSGCSQFGACFLLYVATSCLVNLSLAHENVGIFRKRGKPSLFLWIRNFRFFCFGNGRTHVLLWHWVFWFARCRKQHASHAVSARTQLFFCVSACVQFLVGAEYCSFLAVEVMVDENVVHYWALRGEVRIRWIYLWDAPNLCSLMLFRLAVHGGSSNGLLRTPNRETLIVIWHCVWN